jgi:sulfate transport system ATP-binding protein
VRKSPGDVLSGGERRRTEIARALAVNPKFILLDEPFAALDAKIRKQLRSWLRTLHQQISVTTVFVTHDHQEAMELAHEIVILNNGRIIQLEISDLECDLASKDFCRDMILNEIL